ncbi:MAG: RNA 2'-phosphotransferase [Planctomycetia bacterium]|jgi:putative RNA 2'-phosphotransferase
MKNDKPNLDLVRLSKCVAHALRHEPWLYELELDEEGWVPVEAVLGALRSQRKGWSDVTEADLAEMIATSSKRRYEIDGGKMRALYGHSVPDKLQKTPVVPPEVLYHGTAPATVPKIQSSGLLPMGRQYVHLSVDVATATEVGRRKSPQPVILRVLAADAHASKIQFYEGNEKVWFSDRVPPEFIDFNNSEGERN